MSHREPASTALRRVRRGALLVVLLGLIGGGCSKGSSDSGAASRSDSTTTTRPVRRLPCSWMSTPPGGRLSPKDGLRVASIGLRARPLRAALSALGIAIGTAAIVAVLGLSSSSQAGLLAEIDRLGTNMLTVEAGQSLAGGAARLPPEAPARITHRRRPTAAVNGVPMAGPPSSIYLRTATGSETAVQSLLARTAHPEAPYEAAISQPSDVLTARAAAAGAFDTLFLGLGVVALVVGAVGVANIMIISVLERRSEIGLRRALGATMGQIRTQFPTESILLAAIGGVAGVLAGATATAIYATTKHWAIVIPPEAWTGGIASALLIGAFAGLLPAVRASRMPPTVALRTV